MHEDKNVVRTHPGGDSGLGSLDLSIIIAMYNEEDSLPELRDRLVRVIEATELSFEIIFIDDGSQDGSARLVEEFVAQDPRIVLVRLKRNHGKSNALMVGFSQARGQRAVTMDADLQDMPENIPALLRHSEHDLVSAWRKSRHDPPLKRALSRLFNRLVELFFGIRVKDINCGFKVYKRPLYTSLRLYGDLHRMTLVLAKMEGATFIEVPVEHAARKHGKSKYPLFRARGIWDLLSLSVMGSLQLRPFHFFAPYGVALLGLGLLTFLYLFFMTLWGAGAPALAHTLLIVFMLLGVNLFLVGLQLESILNLFRQEHPFQQTIKELVTHGQPQSDRDDSGGR